MVETTSTMLVATKTASVETNMVASVADKRAQIRKESRQDREDPPSADVNCRYILRQVPWQQLGMGQLDQQCH